MKLKRMLIVLLPVLLFVFLAGFSVEPVAECMHLQTGAIITETSHPHREFTICTL